MCAPLSRSSLLLALLLPLLLGSATSFLLPARPTTFCRSATTTCLNSKHAHGDTDNHHAKPFLVGTLIEFSEKKRNHVGKITDVERKGGGNMRYEVEEYPSGKSYSITDKEITFAVPAPNNDKQAQALLEEFEKAHSMALKELEKELQITPDVLEVAWEAFYIEEHEEGHHEHHAGAGAAAAETGGMTPADLMDLVHSSGQEAPTHVEKYEAWRLLRSELGHIYFKEIKEHGRVVAFKPKAPAAVDTSKELYCSSHDASNDETGFCFVVRDQDNLRP